MGDLSGIKKMNIRLAEEKDIPQIARLYVTNWISTYTGLLPKSYLDTLSVEEKRESWKKYIKESRQGIFVAVEDEFVLGFAAFKPYHRVDDCIYLDSLHVNQSHQRKGIGTALIQAVYQQGLKEGYGKMGVCVVKGNDDARSLYLKLGAAHFRDKVDDFTGELTYSEILLWEYPKNVQ